MDNHSTLTRLSLSESEARLAAVPAWTLREMSLERTFEFPSFIDAIRFITDVAVVAERLSHHPDWSNSYRRVAVRLTTHDAGGLTALDFALAQAMDDIFAAM